MAEMLRRWKNSDAETFKRFVAATEKFYLENLQDWVVCAPEDLQKNQGFALAYRFFLQTLKDVMRL